MTSEAQKRYLRKRFAKAKEDETCCDCAGCKSCKGFVRNCTCDHDLTWLKLRNGRQADGQGMADQRKGESSGDSHPPGHVDQADFERFGF